MGVFKEKVSYADLGKIVLFILSPFLSFLISLRDLSSRSSYIVLICICLLFGLNFNVTNDRSAEHNLDGSFYRELFERDFVNSNTSIGEILDDYFSFSSEENTDVYVSLVSLFVSRFTSNYHVLFFVFALVFTYFMAKSLKYLLTSGNFRNRSVICLLLVVLFLQNDIFNINGVRFWTAAWIAVYSVFRIFIDKKTLYLGLIAVTPFIHPSYLLLVVITVISLVFHDAASKLKYLLLISIILSPLMVFVMQSIDASMLPGFLGRYFDLYASDEAIKEFGEKRLSTLYYVITTLFRAASLVYINILVLKIARKKDKNSGLENMFNFLIIFLIFCNLSTILPSIGIRFIVLTYPLIAYMWLNTFGVKQDSNWILAFPLFFILTLRTKVVYYSLVLDSDFFYMNLFHLIFKNV